MIKRDTSHGEILISNRRIVLPLLIHSSKITLFPCYGPFTPNHIRWPSDRHRIAIGWTFYRMGSAPNFFYGWNLFLKDSINEHRFESFYAHLILFLLCCVTYFPLLMWHFQSSLNLISILSASDVCECCIVLYRNPFCPMAIRCPSDEKYFWCEGAIMHTFL